MRPNYVQKAIDKERDKTPEQQAEDIAYTINHAVSCATLDLLGGSPAGSWFSERFFRIGCGHQHHWTDWLKGEVLGDVAAVLPTIATQQYVPGFMRALEGGLEYTAGWAFKGGADSAARQWAKDHGKSSWDPETRAYATELYKHEVSHLPHAFLWTVYSLPISALFVTAMGIHDHCDGDHEKEAKGSTCGSVHGSGCASKAHAHHHRHPPKESFGKRWRGNVFHTINGKIMSSVVLLGARALFPDKAKQWDSWASQTVYYPATYGISALFGIDKETVDRAIERGHHQHVAEPKPSVNTHEHQGTMRPLAVTQSAA